MDDLSLVESILFIVREVSVFKVPPLSSNEGYRAAEWGDLGNPLWKGRMRIVETSQNVTIRLEDGQTGEGQWDSTRIWQMAPYDPMKPSVEAVLDSSRYFVLRVEDSSSGKKAYIGVGFTERSESFDFNVALQDYTKRFKAAQNPPSPTSATTSSPHIPAGPKKDYSLKEGQTFSINLNLGTKKSGSVMGSSSASSGSSSGSVPLLPPPPSAPKRKQQSFTSSDSTLLR